MHYAGIDAHKNYLTVAIVDNQGELMREEGRVPVGDGAPLLEALEGPRPMEAVVETCPFWPWLHDVIAEVPEVAFIWPMPAGWRPSPPRRRRRTRWTPVCWPGCWPRGWCPRSIRSLPSSASCAD